MELPGASSGHAPEGDMVERQNKQRWRESDESARFLDVSPPFDLARTIAPVWWARGRWPNVDWRDGTFDWVGWEEGRVICRSVRQIDPLTLEVSGSGWVKLDKVWSSKILGTAAVMPAFQDPVVSALAIEHRGLRPWAAGSLFEGVVSSIVGQSITVAAAATTERRLYERFNAGIEIEQRWFWPPPLPEQLATSSVEFVRGCGVTTKRAEALVAVAALIAAGAACSSAPALGDLNAQAEQLRAIPGIGPWTVKSALLWGIADPDAHPTGDVALLRAAHRHYAEISNLKELDRLSECWRPDRAWAARLLWLDLLEFDG